MSIFNRRRDISDASPEAAAYREHGQPILEAVTQVLICESWDELLAAFTRYSTQLQSTDVKNVLDALRETFKDDGYTTALIEERAKLLALHRAKGIASVIKHPAMRLKEPTSTLKLFARIGRLKSVADAEAAGKDLTRLLYPR